MNKIDDYIGQTRATAADLNNFSRIEFWPHLAPEALYGLPGRIVDAIAPFSEADPVATLAHVLVSLGNLIGPDPHARVQEDEHPCRLNAVFVGATSKGRKGTAWSTPRAMVASIDDQYIRARVRTGLSSGEGIIYNVRDAREELQPIKKRGEVVGYQRVMVDAGEDDKRLLIFEPELASVLKRMNGETNSLSAVIRQAWDNGNLSTLTKNSPLRATKAHVSIIAHVTREELLTHLTETDRANGFANRFLFFLVKRSKILPEGGRVPEHLITPLIDDLRQVVAFSQGTGEIVRDDDAKAIWAEIYPTLSEGEPGMVGAIISRSEAQVLRLSVLYAVMDCSPVVRPAHLKAALAVWEYAEMSARRIFGDRLGLSVADTILDALRARGPMTTTQIASVLGRNRPASQIHTALNFLEASGKIKPHGVGNTGGRPATVWEAM